MAVTAENSVGQHWRRGYGILYDRVESNWSSSDQADRSVVQAEPLNTAQEGLGRRERKSRPVTSPLQRTGWNVRVLRPFGRRKRGSVWLSDRARRHPGRPDLGGCEYGR